jgi:hypothetical protein
MPDSRSRPASSTCRRTALHSEGSLPPATATPTIAVVGLGSNVRASSTDATIGTPSSSAPALLESTTAITGSGP